MIDPARRFVADIRQVIKEPVEETGGEVQDVRGMFQPQSPG